VLRRCLRKPATVLKTVVPQGTRGSNPFPSATSFVALGRTPSHGAHVIDECGFGRALGRGAVRGREFARRRNAMQGDVLRLLSLVLAVASDSSRGSGDANDPNLLRNR